MVATWTRLRQNGRAVLTMLGLGFSAGLPILLIFSSLSLWLTEAGVSRASVTYFSWAALGYSFKVVWAPLVDQLSLPVLSARLGRRRAWLLLSQLMVASSIVAMALCDPSSEAGLTAMALAAVALGFSSATQDIVVDAFRIEAADDDVQALLAATYVAGYRIAMIAAGAGALYLAAWFGSSEGDYRVDAWRDSYLAMALLMSVGVATTALAPEPQRSQPLEHRPLPEQLRFVGLFALMVLAVVAGFWLSGAPAEALKQAWMPGHRGGDALVKAAVEVGRLALAFGAAAAIAWALVRAGAVPMALVRQGYLNPVRDLFARYGRPLWILLLLVGFYKISDIVMGAVANVFYVDMGFTKVEVANIAKGYGLLCTIAGGFAGGLWSLRYGVMPLLFAGALLSAASNLLFMLLAGAEPSTLWLALVISADNFSGGLASAAFIAYLSALTSIRFTAVQYALFSSLMTFLPKLLAGYAGGIVDQLGYSAFFLGTALLGVPVLLLVMLAGRVLQKG